MTLSPRLAICTLACLLFLTATGSESTDTLPEVQVTGRGDAPAIVAPQTLQGTRLQGLGAQSVADALRYFSGVQLKEYGGVGGVKTIDVRSMGSHHTGVAYDGIQLGNAQNGQIDLGRYSLDNVEAISLYAGQKASIFQTARDYASGASIYITTRRPRFSPHRKLNATAQMRTGSFGLVNPSALLEYRLTDSIALSLSAEYTHATGKYKFRYRKIFSDGTMAWDTTATRQNGTLHALRLEGGAFGTFRSGRWRAKAYFYDSGRGIPGAIVNNVWKNSQRQWDRNLLLQFSLRQSTDERYLWMANAKYARDRMRYLNPDTTLMYIDNTFVQQEFYLNTTHLLHILPCWQASLAADWNYNTLASSMAGFKRPRRSTFFAALSTQVQAGTARMQGSLLMTRADDTFIANPYSEPNERAHAHLTKFTPSLTASWQLPAFVSIHAFAKRVFRLPTFNDLYYTDMGNASLLPERADQYDVGADWDFLPSTGIFTAFSLSADGYYNYVRDKIIAVPKGTGQYRWMMTNIGRVKIWGTEVRADASASPLPQTMLHLRATYTFQSARDFTDPSDCHDQAGTYKGQIAYVPRHSFSITADAAWRDLTLNYSFIYVGRRWDSSSNIPANLVQPWYTHDLSASYRFTLRETHITATLDVNNLLDQQYEVIRNYPMPGRNFRLTLRLDL